MDHPNVISLVKAYKATKKHPDCRLVVMSLANGPNLQNVVEIGGAVGLPLARLISRHLVVAVSYLHTRAVIHRDIKTDNAALCRIDVDPATGSYDWKKDDLIWSDGEEAQRAVDSGRWRVILVDFGMARALAPEDMGLKAPVKEEKKEEGKDKDGDMDDDDEAALLNSAQKLGGVTPPAKEEPPSSSPPKKPSRRTRSVLGRSGLSRGESISRIRIKRLSALGTYDFAAPEISEEYRKKTKDDVAKTKSLTKCIADYGLIADAYSLGTTLKECLTGVPASVDAMDAEAYMKKKSKQSLGSKLMGKKKRKRVFRKMTDLPSDAALLVNKLSERNAKNRITVREAQINRYISGGMGDPIYKLPQGDIKTNSGSKMVYLRCASDGTFDKEVE